MPIGPVLGDDAASIGDSLPGSIRLTTWPSPLLLTELIGHAAAAAGISLHLTIAALAFGVPVFRPAGIVDGKYAMLLEFDTVATFDNSSEIDPQWFGARLGRTATSPVVQAAVSQLSRHWDQIAASFAAAAARPAPLEALGHFWQSLPGALETGAARYAAALDERDAISSKRDAVLAERNAVIVQYNTIIAQLSAVDGSNPRKITAPLHALQDSFRRLPLIRSKGMKILVAGQAKSGTTALYSALQQSLPDDYTCLAEPQGYVSNGRDPFVLCKVLINPYVKINDFECFDKKILLVRDPRDNLVSRLLYAIFDQKFLMDDNKVRFFIERLEQKQRTPSTISAVELLKVLSDLSGENLLERFVLFHQGGLNFDTIHPDYFVYKYEDFVAGKFSRLEEYLGFDVSFSGNVNAAHRRVVRTKGSGDWRNWFTDQDVKYFGPIYQEYLVRHGYELAWVTNPQPKILPEHSTEYVMRLVREWRANHASRIV